MSGAVNIGDLPSWMLVLLIGIGLAWASSKGALGPAYAALGDLLVLAGLGLGAFYFAYDISRKV